MCRIWAVGVLQQSADQLKETGQNLSSGTELVFLVRSCRCRFWFVWLEQPAGVCADKQSQQSMSSSHAHLQTGTVNNPPGRRRQQGEGRLSARRLLKLLGLKTNQEVLSGGEWRGIQSNTWRHWYSARPPSSAASQELFKIEKVSFLLF